MSKTPARRVARAAVRKAINEAKEIYAETGDDPAYQRGQDRIREAEAAAGPLQSWIARLATRD